MKALIARDIPPRAAALAGALVLLASIVTGREQQPEPDPAPPANARAPEPQPAPLQDLELEKLVRQRSGNRVEDLFASQSWAPAVAPTPPAPPAEAVPPPQRAVPVAPPLPFAYLGRMIKRERTLVYVLKGEDMLLVEAGQTLGDYRVEGISDAAVHFLYVPLGEKQTLRFPARE